MRAIPLPKVYIVILNWNGWKDTVECLESLFRSEYENYDVIVCDNGSTDGSIQRIQEWADGKLAVELDERHPLKMKSFPPISKPLRWIQYDRHEAERGGESHAGQQELILIQTGANLGFAAGNNVGLRYALARADFEYAWLLNNDTVVEPNALSEMVAKMSAEPGAGICGSTLLYYSDPTRVQALGGGTYFKWLGGARFVGGGLSTEVASPNERALGKMDYVAGASMLVRESFLREVGLMSEDYFLYFEEIDWAVRAQERYSLAYADGSVVYHKEGSSTGGKAALSVAADFWNLRNRLVFTRKFYRFALPGIYVSLLLALLNRLRKRQWERCAMILGILVGRTDLRARDTLSPS